MIMGKNMQGSIKEAFDNLPSGICIFTDNGLPILCNRTMYRLAFDITGRDLQTLDELETALGCLPAESGGRREDNIYLLADGNAWRFSMEKIRDENGVVYTQVTASEVSALYHGSKELAGNIEKLKETALLIGSMKKDLAAITRENEILSMKMKIHDELGSSLLKLRRYYLGTDSASREELLENWKKTVSMLKYKSGGEDADDPMADLLHSARSIGVRIVQTGEMPEEVFAARLLVRVVRECLTNAVRHAGGNRIFVSVTKQQGMAAAVITNDGIPPEGEIVEGGGLSSLRKRIEKAGGTMTVQSRPAFALTAAVPLTEGEPGK